MTPTTDSPWTETTGTMQPKEFHLEKESRHRPGRPAAISSETGRENNVMMNSRYRYLWVAVLLAALSGLPAAAQPVANVSISAAGISWAPIVEYDGLVLTVSGNDRYVRQEFAAGERPSFAPIDQHGNYLPDGNYAWEMTVIPSKKAIDPTRFENAKTNEDGSSHQQGRTMERLIQSGYFNIQNGALVYSDEEEAPFAGEGGGVSGGGTGAGESNPFQEDFVIADDLIVDGSACIGFDCVNGESFGFDTIRLKENNLRIKFQDTSSAASFPSRDWQLTANSSANGGANKFSIDDIDGGRTPFTVEAGAPSHSLYVDDGGRLGLGTSTPSVEVHTKDGDTPSLRLEQDGSSGFGPQTWDVAGNETNFFVRDVSNGSTLPFRIRPGAPTSSIFVDADGDVGIGTSSPGSLTTIGTEASLHIRRTDGEAAIFVEEASSTSASRSLMELTNNGPVRFDLTDTSTASDNWRFVNVASGFQFNRAGTGFAELFIEDDGDVVIEQDLTVNGTFANPSSREIKTAIELVDNREVLARVADLPVSRWNYDRGHKSDAVRHLGPMAEDFYAAFEIGRDNKTLSPLDTSGVALAAVKGLNEVVEEKDVEIAALKIRNDELAERLARLEAVVAELAAENR